MFRDLASWDELHGPNLFASEGSLTMPGTYPFSVIALDANNNRGYRNYKLIINPAP
jgi:hypothetical protein